jgi:nicotinate phosphoribosyltransferase
MGNVIFKQFNNYTTTWTFKCRNEDVRFSHEMIQEIKDQFDYYCTLRFTDEELSWLKTNLPWLSEGYINYLRFWHPVREEVSINENGIIPYNDCGLAIEAKGTWLNTSMYEIVLLAIVNEVYFSFTYDMKEKERIFKENTMNKIKDLINHKYELGKFSEFGLRRRLSKASHDWLINTLSMYTDCGFVGTSNVFLAKKYDVKAVGTMAHELIQAIGQGNPKHDKAHSNYFTMKAWTDEYKTLNGIYLTDCITTDCFLKDFDLTYATLFSGVRHDSGDPIEWGEKMLNHYKKLNINAKTKTLLFSDSLNFEKATNLYNHFKDQCHVAFGIGTYLSNDTDVKPLNIVMKITECNGAPVAKISDSPGKGMCRDNNYVDYLTRCIKWRMTHE